MSSHAHGASRRLMKYSQSEPKTRRLPWEGVGRDTVLSKAK